MRKLMLGTAAIALAAFGSHAFAESRLPRGLVGFTTATTTGDAGVLGMTKLCQAEFPASRMCTSAEIISTQTVPSLLPSSPIAWVLPSLGGAPASGFADPSGLFIHNPPEYSCEGWTSNQQGSTGLGVDHKGSFTREPCEMPHRVACCAGQPELLGDIDRDGDLDLADSALIRRYLAGEVSALPG